MTNSPLTDPLDNTPETQNSLVPKGVTYGLGGFALLLAFAWMAMSMWSGSKLGQSMASLLPRVAIICAFFLVAVPLGFVVGARAMNRFSGNAPIQDRNALTLGLLFTCVAMLWVMSVYS